MNTLHVSSKEKKIYDSFRSLLNGCIICYELDKTCQMYKNNKHMNDLPALNHVDIKSSELLILWFFFTGMKCKFVVGCP